MAGIRVNNGGCGDQKKAARDNACSLWGEGTEYTYLAEINRHTQRWVFLDPYDFCYWHTRCRQFPVTIFLSTCFTFANMVQPPFAGYPCVTNLPVYDCLTTGPTFTITV